MDGDGTAEYFKYAGRNDRSGEKNYFETGRANVQCPIDA
jgi:hypothetical protein